MKLKRREKILAGLAAGFVVLLGLWFLLLAGDPRSYDQLVGERDKLTNEIADKQKLLQAAARDAKRLTDWQQRALPPDLTRARSLYQDWLYNLGKNASLRELKLNSVDSTRRDQFTRISYTLHAQARWGDLVQFMYGFYSAGFLHQIRKIDIKPNKSSRDLNVELTIEALSLPTAASKDQLPKEAAKVLQFAKLADYRDPMVKRDFFAPYVRRTTVVERRERPPVDPADFAFVTAFTEVDGAAKVWVHDRLTGKPPYKLGIGENFTIGNVKGTVQTIRPEGEVTVDFDGRRRVLHMGDNLHGGKVIEDQRPKQAEKAANPPDPDSDEDN